MSKKGKIAIVGANGQLGSDLVQVFSEKDYEVIGLTHQDIEITRMDSVRKVLHDIQPQFIFNSAAYHDLEQCQNNLPQAFLVNSMGPHSLALVAEELSAVLVHYSTNYVFEGTQKKPYTEDSIPYPINLYGWTKWNGENFLIENFSKFFIIRISSLYGRVPSRVKGENFITKMIDKSKTQDTVHVIKDEFMNPTWTRDIAENTAKLIETDAYGLYHMASHGGCSWYTLAKKIFQTLHLNSQLKPCKSKRFSSKTSSIPRPRYTFMENKKLQELQIDVMPDWEYSLDQYLRELQSS